MHTKNTKGLAERGHESKPSKRNRSCNEETPARRTVISAESLNRTDCLRAVFIKKVSRARQLCRHTRKGITAPVYFKKSIS